MTNEEVLSVIKAHREAMSGKSVLFTMPEKGLWQAEVIVDGLPLRARDIVRTGAFEKLDNKVCEYFRDKLVPCWRNGRCSCHF